MAEPIDPYYAWLGIPPEEQPPDHYRLLGLPRGEGDPRRVSLAARRQIKHIKTCAAGAFAEVGQRILNQVTRAKSCLLHPSRRARYDAALQAGMIAEQEQTSAAGGLAPSLAGSRPAPAPPPLRRWVVGAAADCDIVVDRPTVSRRHCCLTQKEEGCFLEDLGSTNGTYLNGRKVTTAVMVCSRDAIRLGQSVALPWPAVLPASSQRLIRIGAAPDNDVVLDFPMISWHHAVLRLDGPKLILQDLGSTNGTAVGNRNNYVLTASLSSDDTVYFGSRGVPVARLIGAAANADVAPATPPHGR